MRANLLTKYFGEGLINNLLHKASKIIFRIIAEENVKPIMEDLKGVKPHGCVYKCERLVSSGQVQLPLETQP